jgi:hypothetical protein
MPPVQQIFEPAIYSIVELRFFLDHVGEPPKASMYKGVPKGVNPAAVNECLGRIYDLVELERHQQVGWAGLDTVKDSITRYLDWHERCLEIQRRGGPRHASLFGWEDGRPVKGAIGADSTDMVRSEILEDGSRRKFAVDLLVPYGQTLPRLEEVAPWLRTGAGTTRPDPEKPDTLEVDRKGGLIKCSVCGKSVAFDADNTKSYNMARAQIARHLRSATKLVERHHRLLRREFK